MKIPWEIGSVVPTLPKTIRNQMTYKGIQTTWKYKFFAVNLKPNFQKTFTANCPGMVKAGNFSVLTIVTWLLWLQVKGKRLWKFPIYWFQNTANQVGLHQHWSVQASYSLNGKEIWFSIMLQTERIHINYTIHNMFTEAE